MVLLGLLQDSHNNEFQYNFSRENCCPSEKCLLLNPPGPCHYTIWQNLDWVWQNTRGKCIFKWLVMLYWYMIAVCGKMDCLFTNVSMSVLHLVLKRGGERALNLLCTHFNLTHRGFRGLCRAHRATQHECQELKLGRNYRTNLWKHSPFFSKPIIFACYISSCIKNEICLKQPQI